LTFDIFLVFVRMGCGSFWAWRTVAAYRISEGNGLRDLIFYFGFLLRAGDGKLGGGSVTGAACALGRSRSDDGEIVRMPWRTLWETPSRNACRRSIIETDGHRSDQSLLAIDHRAAASLVSGWGPEQGGDGNPLREFVICLRSGFGWAYHCAEGPGLSIRGIPYLRRYA
jgi:hypothetical protein